jgi:TRAP-type C4-dicarboxylate transport system permease small subunit
VKRVLANGVEWVSAVMVVALALVVFVQVFNRFVLQTPLAWSEDLAMLLFQWVAFLGAALGVKRMSHFGIELVVKALPERAHRWVAQVVPVCIAIVALIMITEGVTLIRVNMNRTYSTMDLSYVWTFLPIPVSGVLILLYLVGNQVRRWRGTEEGGERP